MPNIPHAPLYTYYSSYNHTQSKQIIQEQTGIQSQHCSRPVPRSGWGVSLRRGELAQANPFSPRRGLERASRNQRGISLRRDPSRLGEMFARSKIWAGRLGDPSHKLVWANPCLSRLGETGPLRRD